ncbi:hypothetical protein EHS39_32965 [Ensifer sp. MPMI2T]|nr:hypothetical protein EHS39_32965 [Ensifer sp. MPMI2T]
MQNCFASIEIRIISGPEHGCGPFLSILWITGWLTEKRLANLSWLSPIAVRMNFTWSPVRVISVLSVEISGRDMCK